MNLHFDSVRSAVVWCWISECSNTSNCPVVQDKSHKNRSMWQWRHRQMSFRLPTLKVLKWGIQAYYLNMFESSRALPASHAKVPTCGMACARNALKEQFVKVQAPRRRYFLHKFLQFQPLVLSSGEDVSISRILFRAEATWTRFAQPLSFVSRLLISSGWGQTSNQEWGKSRSILQAFRSRLNAIDRGLSTRYHPKRVA